MRRLLAAILSVGALVAVLPGAALAGKEPTKAAGSCGTSSNSGQQFHDGFFFNGLSGNGGGINFQDCTPH
jgi:hypothetical protein